MNEPTEHYKIALRDNNGGLHQIPIRTNQTVLDSLQQAGFLVRQACVNGACGVCRCRVQAGVIDYRQRFPHGLRADAIENGYILTCIAWAKTDLALDDLRISQ